MPNADISGQSERSRKVTAAGVSDALASGMPNGRTKLFPVLGEPIDQVRSPTELSRIFEARKQNALVVPMHAGKADLPVILDALWKTRNVGGALITVPHKQATLLQCATSTNRAQIAQSTNVLRRSPAGWHGDNTDGLGYLEALRRCGFVVAAKRVLLVGCGGAGASIAVEMLEQGASTVALHDVDAERRDSLMARLSDRYPDRLEIGSSDPSGFELIANASPAGMAGYADMPVEVSRLQADQFVACVVTEPRVPPFIAAARALGCPTMTGEEMFDAQAELLADFLLGKDVEIATNPGCSITSVSF